MPRWPAVLLILWWLLPAAASADSHLTRQVMPSGGGSVGAGNPMQTITVVGEPFGGLASNGQTTVRGGGPPGPSNPTPPDTIPPSGSVVISAEGGSASGGNGGAAVTNNPTVTLTLAATDDSGVVSHMRCSNDGVTYAPSEPYSPTRIWTLSNGDGTKTVYVKFADPSGNWSEPASDTIILDTTPPRIAISSPRDGEVVGP